MTPAPALGLTTSLRGDFVLPMMVTLFGDQWSLCSGGGGGRSKGGRGGSCLRKKNKQRPACILFHIYTMCHTIDMPLTPKPFFLRSNTVFVPPTRCIVIACARR